MYNPRLSPISPSTKYHTLHVGILEGKHSEKMKRHCGMHTTSADIDPRMQVITTQYCPEDAPMSFVV